MNKFFRYRRHHFLWRLFAAFVLIVAGFYLSSRAIRPTVISAAKLGGKTEAERIIHKIFSEEFGRLSENDVSFITVSRNENSSVTSIETDTAALSDFSFSVATRALEALRGIGNESFTLSSGSLSGNPYLAGKGPKIPFRIETGKIIHSEVKSDFISAGINATLHSLTLILSAEITVFLAGFSEKETVSVSAPISETIIMGEVPESFMDLSFLKRSFETKN